MIISGIGSVIYPNTTEREVQVLRGKADDTRNVGISQTVSQRKARGRHTDTQRNPAIPQ